MAGQYDDAIIAYLADPTTLTRRTTSDIAVHLPHQRGGDEEWKNHLGKVRKALRSLERYGMIASAPGTGKLAGQLVWRLTAPIEEAEPDRIVAYGRELRW